jgi:hypothetical protein
VRACVRLGRAARGAFNAAAALGTFGLFVCLFARLFVSFFGVVFLSDGLHLRAQALIVLSLFKPVVDLRRRAVGHEVDGAPFNTQARLGTASHGW